MTTEDTDVEPGWWVPHLVAAVLGFVLGGWLFGRLVRRGEWLDHWLLAAALCGVVCAAASIWFGRDFWSLVRRLFGR